MRIIGELPHPVLKITVFQASEKLSIKFEHDLMEQIYKFRDGSGVNTIDDAKKWLTPQISEKIVNQFLQMARIRYDGLHHLHDSGGDQYPVII